MHISRMVSDSAALRPMRSEYMPSSAPPSGRMKKPTENVPSDRRSDVNGSAVGKNSFAITAANTPYSMKLYHSSPLPITAAITASGPGTAITASAAITRCCIDVSPRRQLHSRRVASRPVVAPDCDDAGWVSSRAVHGSVGSTFRYSNKMPLPQHAEQVYAVSVNDRTHAMTVSPPKAFISWSSGKDSAFALLEAHRLG